MNSKPTGPLTILGDDNNEAQPGMVLTARPNAVKDADGIGFKTFQWMRDGKTIAEGQQYTVVPADVGHSLQVVMSYQDGAGNQETVTSTDVVRVPDPVVEALHAIYFLIFDRRGDDAGMAFYADCYRNVGMEVSEIAADMEKNRDQGAK